MRTLRTQTKSDHKNPTGSAHVLLALELNVRYDYNSNWSSGHENVFVVCGIGDAAIENDDADTLESGYPTLLAPSKRINCK